MSTYQVEIDWIAPTTVPKGRPLQTSFTRRLTAFPDPKRPGMMKMTEQRSRDGYTRKYSYLYGKKNQGMIQEWIAKMVPVA